MTQRLFRMLFWVGLGCIVLLFAFQVRRYYFIGDDAFISFRYARHLASGQGLVWNPGERVEGYTNFLWVLLSAGAIRLGLHPERVSNLVGILSGFGVLFLISLLAVRLSTRRTLLVLVPALALALSRTFAEWTTGGLETMWFTLLVTAGLFAIIEESRHAVRIPVGSAALFGLASLTRPEGILFAAISGSWLAVDAVGRRRWQSLLIWSGVVGVIVGSHLLWRHAYYGAWVPNTFAAKVPAAWWDQGLKYAYDFAQAYGLPVFLPLPVWALWRRPERNQLLLAVSVGLYGLYVIAVGGDRFEFRFWVPILPLTYWLIADALQRLPLPRLAGAACVLVLIAAMLHGSWQSDRAQLPPWHGINSVANIKSYAATRIEQGRRLQQLIEEGVLSRNVVLAVRGAGAVPYYSDWPTVDRHGLNDRFIAHLPIVRRGVIAHEHDAPPTYLEQRHVVIDDVFNQLLFRKDEPIPSTPRLATKSQPLYVADLGDRYLVFGSFVPEADVRRALAGVPLTIRVQEFR